MQGSSLHIWGDSILKGIVFDEGRGRYAILRENCITALSAMLPVPTVNNARMGQTAPKAQAALCPGDMVPGGIALVEFGGNDCDMPWGEISADPLQDYPPNTPLPAFTDSLEQMVRELRQGGMEPVLVVPTPLDAPRYFRWISRALNPANILAFLGDVQFIYRWQERYANAVISIAARLKTPLINLREAFLEVRDFQGLFCVDGIHPSARGHEVMLDALRMGLAV